MGSFHLSYEKWCVGSFQEPRTMREHHGSVGGGGGNCGTTPWDTQGVAEEPELTTFTNKAEFKPSLLGELSF